MAARRSGGGEEGDRATAARSIIHHSRSAYRAVSVPLTSDLTAARPTVYNIKDGASAISSIVASWVVWQHY